MKSSLIATLMLAAVSFLTGFGLNQAHAERRVALVLGNSAYKHVPQLPNPVKDATAMAAMLQNAGFEVISGMDLTHDQMSEKISQFSGLAQGADAAVFFYAGHGVQIADKNYLIPTDANLRNAIDVSNQTIDAGVTIEAALADAKFKLVLLDACRDNPFAQQMSASKTRGVTAGGLAAMQAPEGTLISFATSPGRAASDGDGDHSPFSRALLTNLIVPGVEIDEAMKAVRAQVQAETKQQQLPWENTNTVGKFFLVPGAAAAMVPASTGGNMSATAPVPQPTFDTRTAETEFWKSIEASPSKEGYEAYLKNYPQGIFAALVPVKLASLDAGKTALPASRTAPGNTAAVTPQAAPIDAATMAKLQSDDASQATEDALLLDLVKWRDLQAKLTALGFNTNGVDGSVGPGTRAAVSNWQTSRHYKVSTYLNKVQMDALLSEVAPVLAPVATAPHAVQQQRVVTQGAVQRPHYHSGGGGGGNGGGVGSFMNGVGQGIGRGLACGIMKAC